MKKQILLSMSFVCLCLPLVGCSSNAQGVKELAPYVFEVDKYSELDFDYADKFWADDNDNWGGGCSAITKIADNGHRLIGRNMDLNISKKAAYIVRTSGEKFDTLGLSYTFRDYSPDYEDVKKNGISSHFSKILPFICDDVMNNKGLHIEVNMRHGECYPDGRDMFAVESTNPGKRRVHMFELPRYVAENCSTVAEAKHYIENDLDIYSKNGYWNYCFIISDQKGDATLLEFSDVGGSDLFDLGATTINWIDEKDIDKVDWLDTGVGKDTKSYKMNGLGQTNFYINYWAYLREDQKSGEGRFIALQEGIKDVHDAQDMYNLMNKISYSSVYLPYEECKKNHFDPRSENLGEFKGASYDLLLNSKLEDKVSKEMDKFASEVRSMTREEKMEANAFWESTFTEVVDTNDMTIMVRMYEDESLKFMISFDGTERLK